MIIRNLAKVASGDERAEELLIDLKELKEVFSVSVWQYPLVLVRSCISLLTNSHPHLHSIRSWHLLKTSARGRFESILIFSRNQAKYRPDIWI